MAILDDLYTSVYDRKTFNCAHFAGLVWERLTGDSRIKQVASIYSDETLSPLIRFKHLVQGFKLATRNDRLAVILCEPPFDSLHMGVLWEGDMIHLTPGGVECFPLETYDLLYKNMRFYR